MKRWNILVKMMKKICNIEAEDYAWDYSLCIAGTCLSIFENRATSHLELINKKIDGWKYMSHPTMVYTYTALKQFIDTLVFKNFLSTKDFQDRIEEASLKYRNKLLSRREKKIIDILYKWRNFTLHDPKIERLKYEKEVKNDNEGLSLLIESGRYRNSKNCRKYLEWVIQFTFDVEVGIINKEKLNRSPVRIIQSTTIKCKT